MSIVWLTSRLDRLCIRTIGPANFHIQPGRYVLPSPKCSINSLLVALAGARLDLSGDDEILVGP